MTGWIKIHRDIREHWVWQDATYFKWWATILLSVNHEDKKFPVGTELMTCKAGESFRSIDHWTDLFSCSKKTTIRFFRLLEKDGMIKTKTVGSGNRRKHLLTVVNWKEYQQTETEESTERVPGTPPKEYPNVPPNKNDKNEKNIKPPISPLPGDGSGGKNDDKPIDYKKLVDLYHQNCPELPKVKVMSEERKKAVRARVKQYGRDAVVQMLTNASLSPHLKGENRDNWTATFDWLFTSKNFIKVLEGNYLDRKKHGENQHNNGEESESELDRLEAQGIKVFRANRTHG